VIDDESGESMEPMEEVPLKELGALELDRLVRDWRLLVFYHPSLFNSFLFLQILLTVAFLLFLGLTTYSQTVY